MSTAPSKNAQTLDDRLDRATAERPVTLGNYDVVGTISAGGMGKVYEAIHRDHKSRVALKTLLHVDPERIVRFKNEFRFVADLCHPNLVPLFELGCHEGLWFITMERIDGVPLLEWVRPSTASSLESTVIDESHRRETTVAHRALPPTREQLDDAVAAPPLRAGTPTMPPSIDRVRSAFLQLARAVASLHAAGVLHLDLKPSNVLVEPTGKVVVLDFGLARLLQQTPAALDDSDESITISGTPTWMAPEQFETQALGEEADWYAIGLMLHTALTGVFPFPNATVGAVWFAKKSTVPDAPRDALPELPEDLSSLASALLRVDPSARPTGREVLAKLSGERATLVRGARSTFVGRAEERAQLLSAYERAAAGQPAIAHVSGASGMGKSALLASFSDGLAGDQRALVLRGRCYERENVPFKAFDGVIDELADALQKWPQEELFARLPVHVASLSRVFSSLLRVDAIARRARASVGASSTNSVVELRRRATSALRAVLALLCHRSPVLLRLDDLQWADADSVALLVGLLEPPVAPKLFVAASFRREEAAANTALARYFSAVREAQSAGLVELFDVRVTPLRGDESFELASHALSRLGVASEGLARRVADESAGSPFFIEELAHFAAQKLLEAPSDRAANDGALDLQLDSVLASRAAALEPTERSLVDVLSVASGPIPLDVWFSTTNAETNRLRALWTLRGQQFVHSTGAGAQDTVELHHDRIRESLYRALDSAVEASIHLRLGRALAAKGSDAPSVFAAVKHLAIARAQLSADEGRDSASLALAASRTARAAGAFRLAYDSVRAGIELLGSSPWTGAPELALALFTAAADAAYLCAEWDALDRYVDSVLEQCSDPVSRLGVWEARIDGFNARKRYADSVDTALAALRELGVELPTEPDASQVSAFVERAMRDVATVGTSGAQRLPPLRSPRTLAAMRLQSRIASATFFARPALFPVLACNGVSLSIREGVSVTTPFAISVFAVVLNSIGLFREAHAWGEVALALLSKNEDRAMDARTRHVVFNLVGVFTVPLSSTLDELRAVVELGEDIGDPEYAAYAGHAFVHNALYAGRPLGALLDDARSLAAFMTSYEQFNALHVHELFVRAISALVGESEDPSKLDGAGFDEARALDASRRAGSRSALFLQQTLMGMLRFHFGSPREASALFEAARPYLDGVASTFHIPVFHQYAAAAIWAIDDGAARDALVERARESEQALEPYAAAGPMNFAHRIEIVRSFRERREGDLTAAIDRAERAAAAASAEGFENDAGLALRAASAWSDEAGHADRAAALRARAASAFDAWGARALADKCRDRQR
ncbi:MAG: AAA family ATPase [Myxococcales bacterium]|nr:AAA family ATPase [Myxococcales bacterium]